MRGIWIRKRRKRMKMKRVTRVIVVEGPEEWVDQTIKQSWLNQDHMSPIVGPNKTIRMTAFGEMEWEVTDESK
jgi:hypothetical protein